MLTFLMLAIGGMFAFVFAGLIALPFILFGFMLKLLFLPFKLLWLPFALIALPFKLLGGMFRLLFGILLIPVVILFGVIFIVGAFITALLSMLAPLIPLALLVLFGWFIYKATTRPSAAPM